MGFWTDIIGTTLTSLKIGKGKAVLDASGLTASRTLTLRDLAGSVALTLDGPGLTNSSLAASVAGNALTIAWKTAAGSDATAANPISVRLRSATAATGTWTERTQAASASLVLSSGSSLGTLNNVPFWIWVVVFDDGGTLRLGAIQASTFSVQGGGAWHTRTGSYPLNEGSLESSTAEGGAGAADSAGVIYTGSAVTSKPFKILGAMEWSAGLGTPGTWASGPTKIQPWYPGMPLPGQSTGNYKATYDSALSTGATVQPADNTVPQSSESNQFMVRAFTPSSRANWVRIRVKAQLYATGNDALFMGIWMDSNTACYYGDWDNTGVARAEPRYFEFDILAAIAGERTYKFRAGQSAAGTINFNGYAGSAYYGGTVVSYLSAEEIQG